MWVKKPYNIGIMRNDYFPTLITPEVIAALDAAGFAIVPKEATEAILCARDSDDYEIWGGFIEHYFGTREYGHRYGREAWRAMVQAAIDSA